MLVKYCRNKHGHPYGAVVAVDPTHVGWSMCHVSMGDVFRKDKAIMIAEGRALKGYDKSQIPQSIQAELTAMTERAARYFKGAQI